MADDMNFNIAGLTPILQKLKSVSDVVRKQAGRTALRQAGMIIVKAAAASAAQHDDPATGRSISKNVAIQWNNRRFKATGDISFRIGVRGGAVVPKGKDIPDGVKAATPHWRFIEFGTKVSIAKPFLRPAMSDNIQAVTNAFSANLNKALDKALRK